MNHVSLLIKPASSLCNLRCKYCFYADEIQKREQSNMGIMQRNTAERLIDASFTAQQGKGSISFSFQGGEPTLAGLDFFEAFTETVEKRNVRGIPVCYAIQTNGMLIDERWATFLKKHHFLVGVSIDGDKTINDENRVDAQKMGTYARVMESIRLLQRENVDINLLCVVTGKSTVRPQKVYQALKKLGINYLQFIPCLDPLDERRGQRTYSLMPDAYARFLCIVFDCWFSDWQKGRYVSIRQFDDYVHMAMGIPPASCANAGRCGGYLVVESDGSIYPCDFYALDEWKLGNIRQDSVEQLMRNKRYQTFVKDSLMRPDECSTCPYRVLCRGGCKRDWVNHSNYFCSAYQQFFSYSWDRLRFIAKRELVMY